MVKITRRGNSSTIVVPAWAMKENGWEDDYHLPIPDALYMQLCAVDDDGTVIPGALSTEEDIEAAREWYLSGRHVEINKKIKSEIRALARESSEILEKLS